MMDFDSTTMHYTSVLDKAGSDDPTNFSRLKKWHIVFAGSFWTFNSTLGSSLPSGALAEIADYFGVSSSMQLVLLNSLYPVGYMFGPLLFGPLSESISQQPVFISTYIGYMVFTLGCALSHRYAALLVFRLFCGLCAAAPNAIVAGLFSDIYDDPHQRGTMMAFFMLVSTSGPQIGPIVSGFMSLVSWQWVFWVALLLAAAGLPIILLLPETYVPVLQRRREMTTDRKSHFATKIVLVTRKEIGVSKQSMLMIFARPFVMTVKEPILLLTSLYMAFIYAILYLFFQAYPIVFQGLYGMSSSLGSLAFVPMIIGDFLAFLIFMWYSIFHRKASYASRQWATEEEYRRLPLACIGAPAIVVALFWLSWTSYESIHPIIPMIAGIWFGLGYLLIFMAMLNYLTDAYRQNSASALAAASTIRSITAVCLPLATDPMHNRLGIHWATSLLGFAACAMALIPFLFIRYGSLIRTKSPFCSQTMVNKNAYT
ncbi:MFS general substrate transporter [Polychaeton citri CBS 116435]|uniref:MFS general substrate transporter n=1 Tax=Polychaeton citri CBS 116435 TaxID=1314669 RepID=A0A9P4PZL1_9PEZI|nr:MFS general substrate transporter [Polychaeton citri CBS 116435]